ncbi:MAG: sulfurtransferase TusA family protein [Acidiferrobacterales bacterium]
MKPNTNARLTDASDITYAMTLELTGISSPGPLPAVKKALSSLVAGQILLLTCDYPSLEVDLFVWAQHTNNQILMIANGEGDTGSYYILKGDPWKVDRTLDISNFRCPTPVVEAGKALLQLQPGQTLKLVSNCRAAVSEVNTWVKTTRYRLLGITEDAREVYRFYICK